MIKKVYEKKIQFISNAFLVWVITQISLQILLTFNSVSVATLSSQIIYLVLGFRFYGKNVFNIKKLSFKLAYKFFLMSIFLWLFNNFGINLLLNFTENKNISAIFMIPFLALTSFLIQKNYIFK